MKFARLRSIRALMECSFVALFVLLPHGTARSQPVGSPKSVAKTKTQIAALTDKAFSALWIDNELEDADIEAELRAAFGAGISPNVRDPFGETLLLQAIANEHFRLVEFLLKCGANPNLAILKEDVPRPKNLTPKLQSIYDATSSKGETPLMRMVEMNESIVNSAERIRVVKQLLRHGANPNARKVSGQTALMIAALQGESASARLLLQRGADFRYRDSAGQTALQIAQAPAPRFYALVSMPNLQNAGSEAEKWRLINEQQKREEAIERRLQRRVTQGRAVIVKLLKSAGAKS